MINIYDLTQDELAQHCVKLGGKTFNARQIFEWLYKKHVSSFDEMTNISKTLNANLKKHFIISRFKVKKVQVDPKDKTTKFLFELADGNYIETVLMRFKWGNSVCVSSEIGCPIACAFCASGQLKLKRRLSPGEIVLQFLQVNEYLQKEENQTVSNIVVMGIGEPFDNYDNLIKALKILNNPYGIGLGKRSITVSTCGIIDKIMQFAVDQPQANLAISLHAPLDSLRDKLMPINKKYKLEQLFKTIDKYIKLTNSRVTFEYIMLDGINDSDECLKALIKLCRNRLWCVNLIAYNPVNKVDFKRSKRIEHFRKELNKNNIISTLRLERGTNIEAACGQLRAKYEQQK